jgi:hypothetical protein
MASEAQKLIPSTYSLERQSFGRPKRDFYAII